MKRILVVDDVAANLYILNILLSTNGYEVAEASNGKEALENARSNPPDLVITDILMPVMDGFSLCRAWKADEELRNIPLIFYTATYTDPRDQQLALNIGADGFLVKPLEPDILLKNIRSVLQQSQESKPSPKELPIEENQYIREYNEALVRKLEDKMLQLEKTNKRILSLYNSSNLLATLKTENESIHEVTNNLVENAGYPKAIFFGLDEDKSTLRIKEARGIPDKILETYKKELVFKVNEIQGYFNDVVNLHKIVRMDDVSDDPLWTVTSANIRSVLMIPVHREAHLFGVLVLTSDEASAFAEEDEQILSTLVNNLAICLLNQENETKIQDQFHRLSALHKVDMSIASCTDLNLTLLMLLTFVITLLKVEAADIVLLNQDTLTCNRIITSGFIEDPVKKIRDDDPLWKEVIRDRSITSTNLMKKSLGSNSKKHYWESEGFVNYWGVPIIAKGKVRGVLETYSRSFQKKADIDFLDFLDALAGQAAIAIDSAENFEGLIQSNVKLTQAYDATIQGWTEALDLRDRETLGHTQRVTEMAVKFARKLDLKEGEIIDIRRGAILHDIGKICVPDSILFKPGALDEEEWKVMHKHPETAFYLLRKIDYLLKAIDIPYCHHEKWDGTGYPRKLKGKEIPLAARFFSIIDVWDALLSDRSYRNAWTPEKAREFIHQSSGSHFDPDLVPIFFEILSMK